jgi:hypothetical protein
MERLTRPNLNVDTDTDRFLHAAIGGKEIDWKQSRDSTLNVMINGQTSNGFGKDIFRKMVRDLYGRLKAYEDTGLTPEEIKAPFTEDTMINLAAQALGVEPSRLRELTEADKDGRVVVLPCKVGDTVWIVGAVRKLYSAKVRTFFCGHPSAVRGRDPDGHIHMIRTTECDIPMQEFGKTVFLSREEAEKTLREIQGKEDADGATDKPE